MLIIITGTFDYGPVNESVVFKSGESHCISIEIASDGLAEREEDFTVILLVGGVMISSVTVIIASNGRQLHTLKTH